jgi:4-amino-4-deoxy-L-arabinose transferase-like glycosyltransferase
MADTTSQSHRAWQTLRTWLARRWPLLATLVIVAVYTALVVKGLDYYAWHDDESVFALTSKAVYEGHALYGDVWFNYPPGFIQYLALIYHLVGYSLTAARVGALIGGLATLAAVGLIARQVHAPATGAPTAGVGAVLLLAAMPHFVVLSSAAMTEVPAAALATVGVLLSVYYARQGRLGWLAASGAVLSLAMLFKPTLWPAYVAPGLAILLVARRPGRVLLHGLLFSAATVLPFALDVLLTHPAEFAHQFLVTYQQSKLAFAPDLPYALRSLFKYFLADNYKISHVSLLLLGGLGLAALWRPRRIEALMLGGWLLVSLAALLTHRPLYRHHLVVLLPPLAALAGVGLAAAWRAFERGGEWWRRLLTGALLVLLLFELRGSVWASLATIEKYEDDYVGVSQQATAYLLEHTAPGDYIITDGHIVAMRANRETPIETINTSRMRIYTGELTDQQVIDAALKHRPAAILFWEKKLDSTDDFAAWVGCHYDLAVGYNERHRIFEPRPPLTLPADLQRLDQPVGDEIVLLGYAWEQAQVAAGESLSLTLYWQARDHPASDFKVFVHVLDRDGNLVAQDDVRPRQWMCPTWVWQPGERIEDPHVIAVEQIGAGEPFTVKVGLYDVYTGARLAPDHVLIPLDGD